MNKNNYIIGLTGLRGIGALFIVSYHLIALLSFNNINIILKNTFGIGGIFNNMFFVLSSFVLFCRYKNEFDTNTFNYKDYLYNRFSKILPIYFISNILYGLLDYIYNIKHSIYEYIGSLTFTFVLMPQYNEGIVRASWFLAIIVIFYIIFPMFYIFHNTLKKSIISFFVFSLVYIAFVRFYSINIISPSSYVNIPKQLFLFSFGAILYHLYDYFVSSKKIISINNRQFRVILYLLSLLFLTLFYIKVLPFNTLYIILFFGTLILIQAFNFGIICRFKPLLFLGKYSMQIYLLHNLVITILYNINITKFLNKYIHNTNLVFIIICIICLFSTICLSMLITLFITKIKIYRGKLCNTIK